ncbi:MAG: beta strand repeat-containing protein [Limisphaerales bacterium]
MKKSLHRILVPLAALAMLAAPSALRATPYATSLTNNAGVISFRLNESGFVTVITTNLSGAFVTNVLGNRNQGLTVTNIGNPGNFTVIVAKTNTPGFASGVAQQISVDGTNTVALATNTMRFNSPRGVAVNKNPASPLFGRIYVANSASGTLAAPNPRTVGDGFYLLNADGTDAVGQGTNALAAGLPVAVSTEFPGRLEIGPDDNVYVSSGSGTFSNSYIMGPTALTSELAITNGRAISSIVPSGSTNTGNLLLYTIDSDNPGDDSFLNHAKVVSVGSGPFPVSFGTNITEGGLLSIAGVIVDIARGPDGKIYAMQYRLVDSDPNLLIFDPNVDADADGLADLVYNSRGDSIATYGPGTRDYLFGARAVAVSPDGKYLAVLREDNAFTVVPLVNGIPDILQRKLIVTSPTTTLARDIAFDAAGNLYTVSSGQGLLRIYSPGYTTIATTDTLGFFSVTNLLPEPIVNVYGSITNAAEPNIDGEFTFTRTGGDTTQPLTVFYTISGTATRGVDWNTNSISATTNASLTFPANITMVTVPIVVIDDSLGENTETVTFTLTANTNYVIGVNLPATVWIADDGDLPAFSITNLGGTYELTSGRPGKFRVSLSGVINSPLVVTGTLAGTAIAGTDYVGTADWSVTFQPGITSTNFTITPINNTVIASNKTIIATVVAGSGYLAGTPAAATNILRNDDTAPLPILFADNFDTDTSGSWLVTANGAGNEALFAYDYSLDGVPVAPNTTNATTKGLRFRANVTGPDAIQGISASPIGQSFTGDYRLRFDLWMNYNGPLPAGGAGSSQFFTAGLGVLESRTNVPTASPSPLPGSSVLVAVSGDGGFAEATGDYIMITNGVRITATTNVYPAGARDNFNIYYSEFGELAAPVAQATLYLNQTGISPIGSAAFAWHDVILEKKGSNYTWIIDGLVIANVTYDAPTVGNNFTLGHMDLTAGKSDVTAMNFSIVDNLRVESLASTPPVITSIQIINSGADVRIDFNGGTPVGTYTLQATGDLTAGFSDVAATLTDLGGGQFRFVRAVAGNEQFYRIRRTNP